MDTSALIAALVADHEHHSISRPHLSADLQLPAIVASLILPTTSKSVATIFARAVELDLAGSIHDALIAQVCADADVPMVTLDGRQHRLALALGARSRYLLA